jgi:hypothetical protein
MEVRGTCKNDLQCLCAQLAKEYPFARRLNSQARQASADRAWFAIERFYDNCKNHKPGKKGYPRYQHDNRSVEYKQIAASSMLPLANRSGSIWVCMRSSPIAMGTPLPTRAISGRLKSA